MDKFAVKSDKERSIFLQETASRRNLAEIIIEKDFWVCWTLKRLFTNPVLSPYLTFKGGTSLSKAYGLIERFSEDIDLTISRNAPLVSDGTDPMEDDLSSNERKRRIDSLRSNAQRFVQEIALPTIEADILAALGKTGWKIALDDEDRDGQTILFYYPKVFEYRTFKESNIREIKNIRDVPNIRGEWEDRYIKPRIKLEFGARGEIKPNEKRTITPYAAETFPHIFEAPACNVATLGVERTFWEKATILHGLHHGMKLGDRMSRHYYDTYMLDQGGIADKALQNPALLEQVVLNKSLLFKNTKASYETAILGSLRLLPNAEQMPILKKDYERMAEMFMGDYPDFETVINGLTALEKRINKL